MTEESSEEKYNTVRLDRKGIPGIKEQEKGRGYPGDD